MLFTGRVCALRQEVVVTNTFKFEAFHADTRLGHDTTYCPTLTVNLELRYISRSGTNVACRDCRCQSHQRVPGERWSSRSTRCLYCAGEAGKTGDRFKFLLSLRWNCQVCIHVWSPGMYFKSASSLMISSISSALSRAVLGNLCSTSLKRLLRVCNSTQLPKTLRRLL